ncbi:hypothetical protein [Tuwongella immobilis]|uniref:hypothetical protein n=1 Tax=Tuwongella immobilis TaxID=692036 RepID=UPI0013A6BC6B|nr:hypothetical protein [Tuwongella immobilis]
MVKLVDRVHITLADDLAHHGVALVRILEHPFVHPAVVLCLVLLDLSAGGDDLAALDECYSGFLLECGNDAGFGETPGHIEGVTNFLSDQALCRLVERQSEFHLVGERIESGRITTGDGRVFRESLEAGESL